MVEKTEKSGSASSKTRKNALKTAKNLKNSLCGMTVSSGTAFQRLKSALGKDTCSGLIAFVGTSALLGRKRSDSHLGGWLCRDLRWWTVYAYLAQSMVGVWPYPTQLTTGTNWRDVSWE